jgi:hypothetical protein
MPGFCRGSPGKAGHGEEVQMGRSVVTDLLFEEINRTVADAIETGGVLSASEAAAN